MASSPTPSLESLPGANSIGSFGEPTDYLSDSPLTLSGSGTGSSPPISDSAICDDFVLTSSVESQNNTNESSLSSSNSSSSSSGVLSSSSTTSASYPRCTGCKSKNIGNNSAVAKCIDCANYLCANCVTAHEFMHCFDGHSVFRINNNLNYNEEQDLINNINNTLNLNTNINNSSSVNNKLIMNGFESHRLQINLNMKDDTSSLMKSIMNSVITPSINQNSSSILTSMNDTSTTTTATMNNINSMNNLNNSNSAIINNSSNNNIISVNSILNNKPNSYFCVRHKNELLKFYCRTCNIPVCKDCIMLDHPSSSHECEHNNDGTAKEIEILLQIIAEVRLKAQDMKSVIKNAEHNSGQIQLQYHKAQKEINETYEFYRSLLEDRKLELLKELESFYNAKIMSQSVLLSKSQDNVDKALQSCEFVERLTKCAGLTETIMLRKLMENKLQPFLTCKIQDLQSTYELDFVSNFQAIQVGVRNTFGYIRSNSDTTTINKQPPIARPTTANSINNLMTNGGSPSSSTGSLNVLQQNQLNGCHNVIERPFSNGGSSGTGVSSTMSTSPPNMQSNNLSSAFDSNIISKRFNTANSLGPFVGDVNIQQLNPYEKWSNGGSDNIFNINDQYTIPLTSSIQNDTMLDLTSKSMSATIFPPKSQIKRQKMIYHCKFGEFGVMEGQFTEPSGVAVNAQNDIIVADTNNHRIQIFDKDGRFKFQFGECGKRDGQLLYPNRVAVVRTSGDIIVTERSPTHQIQIYNQYGQFVRKFGANILQHPRGVTVDNKGRIIVVECKVMRVIIFDQAGNVLQKFGCSKHLEFPNGVVVNDKQEIFISDNRAHCVKVFNYEGVFLRQIGGEGITNYPIGVGINAAGEILIADNHNNFNLTIFTQDGHSVSALESKVKHAQCFDVALMDDGSVVLASKDYRLYIYRYIQVPQLGL